VYNSSITYLLSSWLIKYRMRACDWQVIYSRYGYLPHISVIFFSALINLFIMGMTLSQATRALAALTTGRTFVVIKLLLDHPQLDIALLCLLRRSESDILDCLVT